MTKSKISVTKHSKSCRNIQHPFSNSMTKNLKNLVKFSIPALKRSSKWKINIMMTNLLMQLSKMKNWFRALNRMRKKLTKIWIAWLMITHNCSKGSKKYEFNVHSFIFSE
jgi:hypothetical protein